MGRIYEERGAREDQCWVWSLFGILANPPGNRSGRSPDWLKMKNANAPAARR
jgi:hypothetical protein